MLDSETKRRIDTARDILVGKVPDPKSQVEQITIALVYKFMDDMDAQAEELGGRRKFFTGDFAQYGWAKLMAPSVSGEERIALYSEGMAKMTQNQKVPALFRSIFKNAFLPYRDPETLKLFLKTINEFEYDHSERLGDAFEYLLSVLGSQGDAGQFRTPRHIIDFIVQIVDPKKDETVLDPACGTAGFLISSYKHILRANSSPAAIEKTKGNGEATLHTSKIPQAKGDLLTPDQRKRLANNFRGYDISPDMVRLSLVNMYLHGFTDPHIFEYDTLTSQERWNETADVILANPPFMSPKGGIPPHNRFQVQSKRSEVLFVDYMAEHLTPAGRAGIIVPEGIIFQSQTAHKSLRKVLVEQYLVAVVSLPAGVFNPYSGVKTSILILDRSLARQSDTIGFFKVENDGFNLGAQRRPIDRNDLPQVLSEVNEYLHRLRAKEPVLPHVPSPGRTVPQGRSPSGKSISKVPSPARSGQGEGFSPSLGLIVPKEKIAENGDYNLGGERYRDSDVASSAFPRTTLAEICDINPQQAVPADLFSDFFNYIDISCVENGTGKFLGSNKLSVADAPSRARRVVERNDILLSTVRPNLRAFTILEEPPEHAIASTGFAVLRVNAEKILPGFLMAMVRHESAVNQMISMMGKGAYPSINQTDVESIKIPLPPLDVQKEIVAEVEGYQKVTDGARAVLDNYHPHIPINPDWPLVTVGELYDINYGIAESIPDNADPEGIQIISTAETKLDGTLDLSTIRRIAYKREYEKFVLKPDTLLFNWRNAPKHVGKTVIFSEPRGKYVYASFLLALSKKAKNVENRFVWVMLNRLRADGYFRRMSRQAVNQTNFNAKELARTQIPLPSITVQKAIVAEIEAERELVDANRDLIARMKKKIATTIARIWGEESQAIATEQADGEE